MVNQVLVVVEEVDQDPHHHLERVDKVDQVLL